jgi:hypothetical protein
MFRLKVTSIDKRIDFPRIQCAAETHGKEFSGTDDCVVKLRER